MKPSTLLPMQKWIVEDLRVLFEKAGLLPLVAQDLTEVFVLDRQLAKELRIAVGDLLLAQYSEDSRLQDPE